MTPLHPILDATKRIRLIYDPNGEARQARHWDTIGVWLLVIAVVMGMVAVVHVTMWVG